MGRTKVFNESIALERAMLLFWRRGYANTSIKQLLAEMEMLNGSFYHAFKDKKTVFLKSLDFYNNEITYKRQAALSGHDDFSLGIRAMFKEIFLTLASGDMPRGCLIVNSMVEEVLCEQELAAFLREDFQLFVAFLTERVQRSIKLGHTAQHYSAHHLGFLFATYIQGLFRVSNAEVSVEQLENQTEYLLAGLGL